MNEEYRNMLPNWVTKKENLGLVLSDDIDSLASCAVLKKAKNWDIKQFYDFEHTYKNDDSLYEECWVDVAIRQGYAFDNHVSNIKMFDIFNEDMVNLNQMEIISREDYCRKYAGSTLLEVWSIYDIPLPETEEGMMVLLAVDSSYLGFFSNNFHDIQKHYLVDVLGFNALYKCVTRHTKEEFEDITIRYQLNCKIKCINGKLNTRMDLKHISNALGIDIELPGETFIKDRNFVIENPDIKKYKKEEVFTMALVYKNLVRCSKEI